MNNNFSIAFVSKSEPRFRKGVNSICLFVWYLESKETHSHSTQRNEREDWKQNTVHLLRWKIFTETEKENGNKNANITIYIYSCNAITHLPPTDTLQLSENVLLTLIYAVELIIRANIHRLQGAIQVASFYFNTMLSHHWNYYSLLAKFQVQLYKAQLFPYLITQTLALCC